MYAVRTFSQRMRFGTQRVPNTEHIEYLMLDESSPIKVAQYYTQLPDKKVLAERLQRAIAIAKESQAEKILNQEKG